MVSVKSLKSITHLSNERFFSATWIRRGGNYQPMTKPPLATTPDPTRRKILSWGGAGVVAGAAAYFGLSNKTPRGTESPASKATSPTPAESAGTRTGERIVPGATAISRDSFLPYLNTEFTLEREGEGRANCKLIQISPASNLRAPMGSFIAFSLLFAGQQDFLTAGGTCRVTHPHLDPMDFALFPVGDGKKQCILEACFTQRA